MKHSPILPYVQTGRSQELRDVQTVMGTFSDPTLCADGTAPGDLGCSNNDETFSDPTLCAEMGRSQELRDVQTVMVHSSDPTLCADGTAPGDLGCSNNDETFSDPTLCADGTSQELRDVQTVMGTFSDPTLCADGTQPGDQGCPGESYSPSCDTEAGQREQSPGVCVSDRPSECPSELPEEQGTNCRGPRQPDGTCLVGNPVGGPNGTQCGGDRVLGDCPPNTRNSEDNPGTCVNDARYM